MSRYEARLQQDLNEINGQMSTLCDGVQESLERAVEVIFSGNEEIAYRTILGDEGINRLSREIDRLCHAFVARHLPSAGHLRRMSSTIRVNLQLERVGDYAVTISRESVQLSARPEGAVAHELELVAGEATRMFRQSLEAFKEGNGEVARATIHLADRAEHTMDRMYADLMREKQPNLKDIVAMFAIYNMLKRVWDQAKNICEETVFAVFGEVKPPKNYKVLFVDEDNSCLGPMAEAIAGKRYSEAARFASGGRSPATQIDPGLAGFMEAHGFDLSQTTPVGFDPSPEKIADYFVVVSLQGPVRGYVPKVPFHTSALTWDVGSPPNGLGESETRDRFEELYREIALHVRELVEQLRGEVA